jgi:hypothetical protein
MVAGSPHLAEPVAEGPHRLVLVLPAHEARDRGEIQAWQHLARRSDKRERGPRPGEGCSEKGQTLKTGALNGPA